MVANEYVGVEWCKVKNPDGLKLDKLKKENAVFMETTQGLIVLCRVEQVAEGNAIHPKRFPVKITDLATVEI